MKTQKKGVKTGTSIMHCFVNRLLLLLPLCSLRLLIPSSWAPHSFHLFPPTGWCNTWPTTDNHDAHASMTTDQLPDRVHPIGSETKYHVFNNQITDNVDIYHSEATTLKPKACSMKYTKNIRAHTVTTHIQPKKTRDFIRTFTILLIPTIKLQMREIHFYGYISYTN